MARAAGLMIGRAAIRNPWLFSQIRSALNNESYSNPPAVKCWTIYETVRGHSTSQSTRAPHVARIKKYLNYIGIGIEPTGDFLHRARRATTEAELFKIAAEYLDHDNPMPLEPFDLELKPRDVLAGVHR